MKNLTIGVDEDTFAKAEQKASALNRPLSEIVAEHVRCWANEEDRVAAARREMAVQLAQPDWHFAVGIPDDREQRNARR